MNAGKPTRSASTGDVDCFTIATETDNDRPSVNGRSALTIQEVQDWCRHMPRLSDTAAGKVACELNHAAFLCAEWAPEFAEQRRANQSFQRMRRIADALATLRNDLPKLLDDSRAVNADVTLTEALLDLVEKHGVVIDKHRHAPGRPSELAGNVAANIGKLLSQLYDPGSVTKKARDAFVARAMAWLTQNPPTDTAISRNRRRRAVGGKRQ